MKKTIITFGIVGTVLIFGANLAKNEVIASKVAEKYELATEIKAEYQLNETTLTKKIVKNAELDKYKGEPKDEIKIEVGGDTPVVGIFGATTREFTPKIKLTRWNEVNFSITPRGFDQVATKDKDLKFEGNKIRLDTPKMSFEMYEATTTSEGEYKYVWYLNEAPTTNKIEFDIETSGLDFFYQPALNIENTDPNLTCTETQCVDIDGNVVSERPENVVGSYAVYHQTKGGMNDSAGKEYKTGKAFHIYRPHIIDASGAETWGILHIENGIYSVEILQDFLDKAVYPIKSNDTIGYTTIGAGANTFIGNAFVVTALTSAGTTAGSSGIMSKFQVAAWDAGANNIIRLAIYTLSGSTYTLLSGSDSGGMTVARTTKPTQDSEWTSSSGVSGSIVNGTVYWIAQNNNDSSTTLWVAMDNGYTKYVAETYSNFPPSSISGLSVGTAKLYSIYATYTASGGAAATPKTDIIWFEEE